MSYLSSFVRYNEFSVLITITKNARNDHLAFEDKPARVLSFIWLHSLSFLVFLESVRKPCSILFRSISYTIDFKCPHKWKSNEFKSGHAIGPPRPIHLFAKCRFKNCLATRLKCWVPSCINRIRKSNISCRRVLQKSTYFVPVCFPSREKGPMKNLSIIPAHTFKLNWCWRLERTITCGFSSSQLWLLWKLNIPSLVKLAY